MSEIISNELIENVESASVKPVAPHFTAIAKWMARKDFALLDPKDAVNSPYVVASIEKDRDDSVAYVTREEMELEIPVIRYGFVGQLPEDSIPLIAVDVLTYRKESAQGFRVLGGVSRIVDSHDVRYYAVDGDFAQNSAEIVGCWSWNRAESVFDGAGEQTPHMDAHGNSLIGAIQASVGKCVARMNRNEPPFARIENVVKDGKEYSTLYGRFRAQSKADAAVRKERKSS